MKIPSVESFACGICGASEGQPCDPVRHGIESKPVQKFNVYVAATVGGTIVGSLRTDAHGTEDDVVAIAEQYRRKAPILFPIEGATYEVRVTP